MKNNETSMKKDFFSDRVREIFLRWKNECGKNKKKYLAGPYLFWSVSFYNHPTVDDFLLWTDRCRHGAFYVRKYC